MDGTTPPSRNSSFTLGKIFLGLFLLVSVVLSVFIVQQEQDTRQEAAKRKNYQALVPTVTPVLPTLAPLTKDQVYTMVTQVEYELDNYLEQYKKDVLESQRVNTSLDREAL